MSTSHHALEYGTELLLDFQKLQKVSACGDVVPVVVQHVDTQTVLILAYINTEALAESIAKKIAVFWSTSRNALWIKGDTSGDYLDLIEIRVNCEQNALLYLVRPRTGGVCHTKDSQGHAHTTCFYRSLDLNHSAHTLSTIDSPEL